MGLCGGTQGCGCAIVSTIPAVGDVNGAFPSIDVTGGGTGPSPWGLELNPNWAAVVADRKAQAYALGATSNQAGIGAVTDITGLTCTWLAVPAGIYLTFLWVPMLMSAGGGIGTLQITDAAGTIINHMETSLVANERNGVLVPMIETGLSGSITRKARAECLGGLSTITIQGSATRRSVMAVTRIA